MADVKAFKALRFTNKAGKISQLVCPPYDIISEDERQAYISQNEHNIIRLELPREGGDPYEKAGETLASWMREGILERDDSEALYIYEEEFEAYGEIKKLKGVMCRVRLEPFENGVVLPHEETLSKAKTDRFNLMRATNCNLSSIYSLFFDEKKDIAARLDALSAGVPDMAFTTADGVIHRVWIVTDGLGINALTDAFRDKKLYIADGHHRYETALNYKKHIQENTPGMDANHPANFVMMMLVDVGHSGLVVFPTHRVIKGLEYFDAKQLIDSCDRYFDIAGCEKGEISRRLDEAKNQNKKAFALYCKGGADILTLKDLPAMDTLLPGMSDAYRSLDVTILHTLILERLLGIDKENMANQTNLTYTRDMKEAVSMVDSGEANCAFIINPTKVDEIAAVAGAGEKMPQKSTYFYPKLITGHVMNQLRD